MQCLVSGVRARATRQSRYSLYLFRVHFVLLELAYKRSEQDNERNLHTSGRRSKCFDSFSMTRLYGRCCVNFLGETMSVYMGYTWQFTIPLGHNVQ